MKYFLKTLLLLLLLSASTTASAERGVDQSENIYANKKVEIGVHTSISNINAHEFVYLGNYKLSELIWDTKNALMIGGDVSVELVNSWNLKLNASFSTNVHKGNSTMDDFDWLYVGAPWSHWSHHNNTTLTQAYTADANLSANIYSNQSNTFNVEAILGFKREQFAWKGVGGTFVYSAAPGFRNFTGSFANIPVITYQQTVDTPYAGLGFDWTEGYLTLGVKLIGSPFVFAKTVDHHILRTLTITDKYNGGSLIGANIDLAFHASENASVNLFFDFQSYSENRGNKTYHNYGTNSTYGLQNGGGMSLKHKEFGIDVTYSF